MVKILNFIFGSVLVLIGLNSLLGLITEPDYMLFIIGGIGAIIMFVPISSDRKFFKFVRRWIFGGFLVLSAFLNFVGGIPYLELIQYGNWFAGLIIIFIGAIYFLSAFERTAGYQIQT